eukprot:UN34460
MNKGDEALAFVRNLLMQHDVRVDIENLDRHSNFIGQVYVKRENGKYLNVGKELLQRGLADIFRPSVERSKFKKELMDALQSAQENNMGIWKDWKPAEPKEEEPVPENDQNTQNTQQSERPAPVRRERMPTKEEKREGKEFTIEVRHIDDCCNFCVVDKKDEDLKTVEKYMKKVNPTEADHQPIEAAGRYKVVAGFFDDGYYRAKITTTPGKDTVEHTCRFLDFGNTAKLKIHQMLQMHHEMAR